MIRAAEPEALLDGLEPTALAEAGQQWTQVDVRRRRPPAGEESAQHG